MERWQDNGIVIAVRAHGEGGAVATLLTETHGRHAGYVYGGHTSTRLRAALQPGASVHVDWQARTEGQLGSFTIDDARGADPAALEDPAALLALQSVCVLLERALPEREPHPGLYAATGALLELLGGDRAVWCASLVLWELSLLRELGFGLDLSKCVVTGTTSGLAYVSPKSGGAVCVDGAGEYRDRLLRLPSFLRGEGGLEMPDLADGLALSGHFIEHRLFAHTTHALPDARARLAGYFKDGAD